MVYPKTACLVALECPSGCSARSEHRMLRLSVLARPVAVSRSRRLAKAVLAVAADCTAEAGSLAVLVHTGTLVVEDKAVARKAVAGSRTLAAAVRKVAVEVLGRSSLAVAVAVLPAACSSTALRA